jgi:very-short-patch-repair endonuclease
MEKSDPRPDYRATASQQFGVVSREDLERAGVSGAAIRRRILKGELERLRPGAYRITGSPKCWEQEVMGVQVWSGSASRISHRSAARLMKLDGFDEKVLEISTTRRLRRQDDVIVHEVSHLKQYDKTYIGPFRTTTAARTLLDLGGVSDVDSVEDAVEDALRRRLTTLAALEWELKQEGGRGHPGSKILRELLRVRPRDYVPMASRLEIRIDRVLRVTQLPPYARQFKVCTRVGDRWPDFAFPDFTVAIEGDGYNSHGGRKAWLYDRQRDRALEALGWDVMHVTWDDITRRRDEFIHDLYLKLIRKGWNPPPSQLSTKTRA